MKPQIKYGLLLLVGMGMGWALYPVLSTAPISESPQTPASEPLYWVAPMDPNYRRKGPGKSPMGMDLVPVYAQKAPAGTVQISPELVNNLGVRTARVERGTLQQNIRTVGYIQYDQDRLVHVHPRVEGWIEKLHVKAAGDPVVKGQPLYDIYSPQLVNAQEELVLAVRRDNQRLIQASTDRLQSLQLSPAFIRQLKQDQRVRQTVTFRSPQTGVVDNLEIREGFFVGPMNTLMSIGSLDEVWVEAEVFERQAGLVHSGLPVTMRLDYLPGRQWRGQVDYIYPSLDATTRTLRVRLKFPNQEGDLRPNMFAQIVIHSPDSDETLVVPKEALIRTGTQERLVLALGEGRFRSQEVRAGRRSSDSIEILEGVAEGDKIVISAQFLLDSESNQNAELSRIGADRREIHDHD